MNNTDKKIYLLYFFLLPFGKLIHLDELIGTPYMFVNISTFVMLFGIVRLLATNSVLNLPHMKKWWRMYAFASFYSFMMAFVYYHLGTIAGKSSFECIPRSIVLNFFAILSIHYNSIAFTQISISSLVPIIKKQNIILLTLGYIQLGMLNGVPGCAAINDALGSVFTIVKSDLLLTADRGITLFGSEPSATGTLMLVTVPFILALDIKEKRWKNTILWSILYFSSGSSQALIMYTIGIIIALFVRFGGQIRRLFFLGAFCVGMFMAFFYTYGINTTKEITNDGGLSYVLYGKLVDVENHSTATRVSTIINDIKIFVDKPLTGVGDGLQAYFYNDNIPPWCANAEEVQEILGGHIAASGGGNFFASFISAYGFIGIILLIIFIRQYRKDFQACLLRCDKVVVIAASISIIIFLAAGWYTISFFNNEYVPLALSLPYLALSSYKSKGIKASLNKSL